MKNVNKVIILSIGIGLAQFTTSYFAYITISQESTIIKVAAIMILNWLIAIIGLLLMFNDYTNIFINLNSVYGNYRTTIVLYDLLKKLANIEEPSDIYDEILEAASEAIPKAKSGSIIMAKNGKMIFEASFGFEHSYLELIELEVKDTALYKYTDGKMDRPVIIKDISLGDHDDIDEMKIDMFVKAGSNNTRSTISAPIIIAKKVVGSINLDSPKANIFNQKDIDRLELFAFEVGKFVQLHQTLELNKNMSRFDTLTGIYNRGYSSQLIKELMKEEKAFILVSADLNNLKDVNDMFGHEAGDSLIKGFVDNMRLFLPDDVNFARYGGDEFIFVFPEYEEVDALVVMDDACSYLKKHTINNYDIPLSVSFCYGISRFPNETEDFDKLIKIADERMYRQKRKYKSEIGLKQ